MECGGPHSQVWLAPPTDLIILSTLSQAFRSAREWILTSKSKTWQERARGPVSDALLWLEIVDWTADEPAVWHTRAGRKIVLTEVPPAAIRTCFARGLTQQKFISITDKKLQYVGHPLALEIKATGILDRSSEEGIFQKGPPGRAQAPL
eukprot:9369299-Pyramimonas_sp.AAC.1